MRGEAPAAVAVAAAEAVAGGEARITVLGELVIVEDGRTRMKRRELHMLIVGLGLMLFLLPACAPAPTPDRTRFTTQDEAAKALMKGLKTNNAEELTAIFGPDVKDLSSGDPVSDRQDRQAIALAMEESWRWEKAGTDRMELIVGAEKWPFPVPLSEVRGGWQFDTDAGKEEVLSRRIGRNELRVIDVFRDYASIQKEYASQPRDGKLAGLYAQMALSSPGRRDGLYWSVRGEEPPSPLGDLVARAVVEGYDVNKDGSQPLLGVPLSHPHRPGIRRERRIQKLHRQWRDVRRIRSDRVSRPIRPRRHHDLHGEPGRRRLSEGPGRGHAQTGNRTQELRP